MSKLHNLARGWWIKAQLKAPRVLQQTVVPFLHDLKEVVRLLSRPYLPMYQWQGQGTGGPLTVIYVGPGFAKTFLRSILFVEPPLEQEIGRIPFWCCRELPKRVTSDIVIVEASKRLVHSLPHRNALVFPQHLEHILDVRGEWTEVQKRFRSTVHKNELRLIRRYNYEFDVSHDERDFEEFFHQMYLPTTRERHGERSMPFSLADAYQHFRSGWLFRFKREGVWVSGGLVHPHQKNLVLAMVGVRNGDKQLIQEVAIAVSYFTTIQWANQHNFDGFDVLGSGPRLKGGLFQHKRKWGCTVSVPSHLHRLIWLNVQHLTPAVAEFLKEAPLATVAKDSKLHGLIVVDDPHNVPNQVRKEWEASYVTPGLSSLLVRSVNSFATEEPADTDTPGLVIPIPLTTSLESR